MLNNCATSCNVYISFFGTIVSCDGAGLDSERYWISASFAVVSRMASSSWPGIVMEPVIWRVPEMLKVMGEFVSFMLSFYWQGTYVASGINTVQDSGTDAV